MSAARLDDLFRRWADAYAAGRDVAATELCRDCPELTPLLAERIAAAKTASGEDTQDPTPAGTMSELVIGQEIGGYRIDELIGTGGMGRVYAATDLHLGRRVAVKTLHPHLATTARERFLREARSVGMIDHEHVVPVYAAAVADGVPYLVMPLLRGETLAARLRSDPWTEERHRPE